MPFDYKTQYERYKKYYQSLEQTIQKPKHHVYSATVFSFLAVSLFGWYAIRPTVQTILYLRREIKDNEVVNQKLEEKISALVEAQANYQNVEPQLPVVNQTLPQNPNVIALIVQLRNLAIISGASLSGVQVPTVPILGQDATSSALTTVKQAKLTDFPLSVTVSGLFPNIQSYLQGLISMRRIIAIDSFSVSKSKELSGTTGSNMLQLTLKLKGYYFSQ